MKKLILTFSLVLTALSGHAKDTDDIRDSLLDARKAIDVALSKLEQTRFVESFISKDVLSGQCVSDQENSGWRKEQKVIDAANFVTRNALAKCGNDCNVSVSYRSFEKKQSYETVRLCEVTAVATRK